MGMEEIFRGIVEIDVNDAGAVQTVANIVERVKAQLAQLGNMPAADIGRSLKGPLGVDAGEIDHQLRKLQELSREMKQLAELHNQTGPIRGEGGKFIAKDPNLAAQLEQINQIVSATDKLRKSYDDVQKARADFDRASSNGFGAQDAPHPQETLRRMLAAGGNEDEIRRYLDLPPREPVAERSDKFRPRSRAQLDQEARDAFPNVEALEFEQLRTRVAQASVAFGLATQGLEKEYKTAEQAEAANARYLGALRSLTQASEALAKSETKMALDQQVEVAKRNEAQRAQADPRQRQLGLSNEEFLKAQGLDLSQSSQKTKIQHELRQNALATQAIESKRLEVATQEDVTKLLEAKKALAIKEIQLKSQLVSLEQKEARDARGDGGFIGGVFGRNSNDDGFGEGFGYQAGITFKYFAFYSLFAALQQGAIAAKEAYEKYTLAVNQLSIALGINYDEADKVATKYAEIGAVFGQGPITTTEAMAKYVRTYGTQPGANTQDILGIGARVGGIVNTLEPRGHADNTQQDLIALAKAFGIGPGGSETLLDQVLAVSRHYGYESPGEVLPGVAAIGDIGKESGYTPAQLTAVIASVMQQTGVGSDAAAGDIKRFLGSQNDPGLIQLFDRFNIDQDGTLKEKMDGLSAALQGLSDEERGRVLTSASNPRIAAAVTALISGIPESKEAEKKALESSGTAAEAAQKKLATFAGQMQSLGVEVEQLLVGLANSGAVDVLGAGLHAFIATIDMVGRLVQALNSMPTAIKDVLGAIALLLAAAKAQRVLSGSDAASGIISTVGSLGLRGGTRVPQAGAAAAAEGLEAVGAAMGNSFSSRAVTAAGALGRIAASAASMAAALAPLAALMLTVTAAAEFNGNQERQSANAATADGVAKEMNDAIASGDPRKIQAAIDRIKGVQKEQKAIEDDRGPMFWIGAYVNELANAVTFGAVGSDDPAPEPRDLTPQLEAATRELARQREVEAMLSALSPSSEWFGSHYNNITRGVGLIQQRGLGPESVTGIIDDLLRQSPEVVRNALQPGEGQTGLPELQAYVQQRIGQQGSPFEQQSGLARLHAVLADAQNRLSASGADLTQLESIRQQVALVDQAWAQSILTTTRAKVESLQKTYTGAGSQQEIEQVLREGLTAATQSGDVQAVAELIKLTDRQFLDAFHQGLLTQRAMLDDVYNSLNAAALAAEQAASGSEYGPGASNALRAEQRAREKRPIATRALQAVGGFGQQIQTLLDAQQLASPEGTATQQPANELAIAQALAGAQSGDGTAQARAQLAAARIRLGVAIRGTAEYYNALKEVNDAERALAEAKHNSAQAELAAGVEVGNPLAAARAAVTAAQREIAFAVDPTQYWNAVKALNEAKYNLGRTELQVALAQRAAAEIPGDPTSAALTAIDAARRTIAFTNDPAEYWNALRSLKQAQFELAQIHLRSANARDLLRIDITDPVAQAEQRVREAQRQLQFDRGRGASTDTILQDQVALRQARSDAEGAAWNQEFQDQRTNYELQRTSLSAYLSYLRSQHDVLTAVKDKTRAQIDQLNAVDQALKGLMDGLDGQWNLGDIKVPTAYEMRRQLASGGGGSTAVSYVTISLTAASDADFRRVLEQYVGQGTMQTVGSLPTKIL